MDLSQLLEAIVNSFISGLVLALPVSLFSLYRDSLLRLKMNADIF